MAVKPYTRWTEDMRVAFRLALRQHGRVREAATERRARCRVVGP